MFGQLGGLAAVQQQLSDNTVTIRQLVSSLQHLSMNAQIQAMHLHDQGRTLEVVASHMNRCSEALASNTHALADAMVATDVSLAGARSAIATSDLSVEMMAQFLREQSSTTADASDRKLRIGHLAEVVSSRLTQACAAADAVARQTTLLNTQLDSFQKQIRTLEILHITGKAEAVRIANASHVSSIFAEVHSSTLQARQRLTGLIDLMNSIEFQPPDMAQASTQLQVLIR